MIETENTHQTHDKDKDKERKTVLAYAAFHFEKYNLRDHCKLLQDLLSRGIEKDPALILATLGSKFIWNPKEMITMTHLKKGKIEHDYEPLIGAYYEFEEKGYNPVKASLLAVSYMKHIHMKDNPPSIESFEKEFSTKEKYLSDLSAFLE